LKEKVPSQREEKKKGISERKNFKRKRKKLGKKTQSHEEKNPGSLLAKQSARGTHRFAKQGKSEKGNLWKEDFKPGGAY